MRDIHVDQISDTVARLCQEATHILPQDVVAKQVSQADREVLHDGDAGPPRNDAQPEPAGRRRSTIRRPAHGVEPPTRCEHIRTTPCSTSGWRLVIGG